MCKWVGFAAIMPLTGCSMSAAPSLTLFGAWFPAWLLCALIGTGFALTARIVMVSTGLADTIPGQLWVSLACGVIVGCLVWVIGFGQ